MTRLLRKHVVLALVVGSAAFRMNSERLDAEEELDTDAKASQPGSDFMRVDITHNIAVVDSTGAARCCCDAHQTGTHAHTTRGVADRSGLCIFFSAVGSGNHHCGDVGRHARTWQTGVLHHYTRTAEQRCKIDQAEVVDVAQALQNLQPSPDYCREVLPVSSLSGSNREALVAVPTTPLGGTAEVSCEAGFEAEDPEVTCVIDTVGAGAFSPAPTCKRLGNWCADVQEGGLHVVAAGRGQSKAVACAEGELPENALVTCGNDGLFHPVPSCIATTRYDVTIRAAEVEASSVARCCCDADHRHLTSMSRWLTGGNLEHTGVCMFVFEVGHCSEIGGRNRWVHYRRALDSRCVVEEHEYRRLNEAYPIAQGWNHEAERIST